MFQDEAASSRRAANRDRTREHRYRSQKLRCARDRLSLQTCIKANMRGTTGDQAPIGRVSDDHTSSGRLHHRQASTNKTARPAVPSGCNDC